MAVGEGLRNLCRAPKDSTAHTPITLLSTTFQLKAKVPLPAERKKLTPLALMFFCILFNCTIFRDTKDVLLVTARGSGAEVIPFIKT